MRIRQSDLASYARCAQQKHLEDQSRAGLIPQGRLNLSATVYGTVVHHALNVLETYYHQKDPSALDTALATFAFYWDPSNIGQIAEVVDEWLPRDTYGGLRARGLKSIRDYYDWLVADKGTLLGLEIPFEVPIVIDGEEHTLAGTMDRLSLRRSQVKFLNVEDHKTGRKKTHLRYDVQFTVYAYATTRREFWTPWEDGDARWELYQNLGRRGTWVNHKDGKRNDAGWRGPQDYARLEAALREYVKANKYDVWPLSMQGDVCRYCEFKDICGGVPLPDEDYGRPA